MALRAIYSVSASSNVDISARIRAYAISLSTSAEEGSGPLTSLVVDDPDGGINIIGHKNVYLSETAESSNQQRIFSGWTADRDVTRGESFRTGSARQWNVNLADPNSLITRRIMRGSDANRPAETDAQRIAWLLGTTEFGGIVTTSRYVSSNFAVAMDAVDYRDQSNQQILDDCAQASGKNYFVFYDEPVGAYGLYYDYAGSSPYRSTLRLSNVLGLIDNDVVFGVSEETKLNRDPSRVYSGVVLPYVGGEVYVQSDAIANAFVRRDTTAPSVNVKTGAKATARANRYLVDAQTESDVISTSFVVPLAKVNHVMPGMAIQCWFGHLPGYDTGWNWMRVLNRTVTATSEEVYTIAVELDAAVGGLYAGGGLTSEGTTFPAPPIVAPIPPQTCIGGNGLTYAYTAGGTRGPLGLVSDGAGGYKGISTTFMQYCGTLGGSDSGSEWPDAGRDGGWGDGGIALCTFPSGGVDYTSGGVQIWVRITTIGPGTLTVYTAVHIGGLNPPCPSIATSASAQAKISGSTTVVDGDSQPLGTPLTIVIPDDGACAHFTDIQASGGAWGFAGATWAP